MDSCHLSKRQHLCRFYMTSSLPSFEKELSMPLQVFTEWFQRRTNSSCAWLWTPFSDKDHEGVFLNMFTGLCLFLRFCPQHVYRADGFISPVEAKPTKRRERWKFCDSGFETLPRREQGKWNQNIAIDACLLLYFFHRFRIMWEVFICTLWLLESESKIIPLV